MRPIPNFNDYRYPDPDPMTELLRCGDDLLARMREAEKDYVDGWVPCSDLAGLIDPYFTWMRSVPCWRNAALLK